MPRLKKQMMLEKLISYDMNTKITVKENEAMAFHRGHRSMYAPGKKVHVAQIVIREREKAEMILNRLKTGEDFGKVSRKESISAEGLIKIDRNLLKKEMIPLDHIIYNEG